MILPNVTSSKLVTCWLNTVEHLSTGEDTTDKSGVITGLMFIRCLEDNISANVTVSTGAVIKKCSIVVIITCSSFPRGTNKSLEAVLF